MLHHLIRPSLRVLRQLGLGAFIALILTACASKAPDHPFLPWDITLFPDGTSAVFGAHLGKDSLLDFKRLYNQKADLAIFVDPDKKTSLEAYFGPTDVGALSANVAIVAQVDEKLLQSWISADHAKPDPTPSGAWKYPMSDEQIRTAQNFPIESITYKPSADYSESLIERRFGKPESIEHAKEPNAYWLYPNKGLLITVNKEGRDLFQYISPKDFAKLSASIPPQAPASP
ncbi:MAG: hypothetical protein JXK51_03935 [Halothiobacillaceae bacterium]|nr:hypothetical protein [Halothiobacillaceae bacterium]